MSTAHSKSKREGLRLRRVIALLFGLFLLIQQRLPAFSINLGSASLGPRLVIGPRISAWSLWERWVPWSTGHPGIIGCQVP